MYTTNKKSILKQHDKSLKKNELRYNEYYNMQPILDNLYKQSKNNSSFTHLYNLIIKDENILLAYRTIKNNKGSKTPGTNRHTIKHIENMTTEEFLEYIKARFSNYIPQKVRRVEIPKSNGKMRPLGIPCIEDRIIQQCIKQILEPICEAKFHPHSYGFRPNRNVENAIAYTYKKINREKCYVVVDIDIKSFFDNVDHAKLLKQMWTLGIRDKKLLSIIAKMLKSEVDGEGIQTKGVPQGGILSPLLSNIVLNELDWWISNQWMSYNTKRCDWSLSGNKYRHLRKSNLKEIYQVRYADDFKIFCKDYYTAQRIFIATKKWLKERLNLEISQEKSTITDVRQRATEFLGFKIKVHQKNNKWVIYSHMTDKAIENVKALIKKEVKYIQKHPRGDNVFILNQIIAGAQNYYRIATHVTIDFKIINFSLKYFINKRFRLLRNKSGTKSKEYLRRYKNFGGKEIYVCKTAIYPISHISMKTPKVCTQNITNYTEQGRQEIHDKLGFINKDLLLYLTENPIPHKSVEYNDNRLSLYSAQRGKCSVTGKPLNINMEVHHKIPIELGGDDKYQNLILVNYDVHKLIHVVEAHLINKYLEKLKLTKDALEKINKYRKMIGNEIIMSD